MKQTNNDCLLSVQKYVISKIFISWAELETAPPAAKAELWILKKDDNS